MESPRSRFILVSGWTVLVLGALVFRETIVAHFGLHRRGNTDCFCGRCVLWDIMISGMPVCRVGGHCSLPHSLFLVLYLCVLVTVGTTLVPHITQRSPWS